MKEVDERRVSREVQREEGARARHKVGEDAHGDRH